MCGTFFVCIIFFFKQKTAYEMRISDWSSDVCSSDLYLKALATKLSLDRDVSANDKFDIILGYRRAETGEVEVGDLLFAGLERGKKKDVNLLKWTADGRSQWFEASGVGEQRGQLVAPVEIGRAHV